jgi:hypothetical protein
MADNNLMTALFKNREDAESAYQELVNRGYTQDDVSVLMSEDSRNTYYGSDADNTTELGNKAAEGTGVGAAIGGTLGAVIAAIAAIGTAVALPGLGLVIAGPIAAAFAGAGAGGLTGGLVGALVGSGIPEERAVAYEAGLREGGIVLGFRPRTDEEADEVEAVWKNHNGDVSYR